MNEARDAKRIYPFIVELMELWLEYPEQRFGQLITNLSRTDDGFDDIWEWDTEKFTEKIREYRYRYGRR